MFSTYLSKTDAIPANTRRAETIDWSNFAGQETRKKSQEAAGFAEQTGVRSSSIHGAKRIVVKLHQLVPSEAKCRRFVAESGLRALDAAKSQSH